KSCWVKKSIQRDHLPMQNFSTPLSNTGQSFQRLSATGRKSKTENLALPKFAKRKLTLMRLFCVLWEASEERCSQSILKAGEQNLSFEKRGIGGNLWIVVRILCGMPCVSQRVQSSLTDRHEQLLWPSCYERLANRQTEKWQTKSLRR